MWPDGIHSAGVSAGIKQAGAPDVGIIACNSPATWAGVFTKNAAAAPSVHWNRALLGRDVRAIVVNSGNANACTGETGRRAVAETAAAAASIIGCTPEEVLVASTGPIGVQLDVARLVAGLPGAFSSLDRDPASFASAIVTTDTYPKVAASSHGACVVGVAKGAAMVAPGMATMLAFLATDVGIAQGDLQEILARAVDRTFNRICIDACESTNDSVLCLATGQKRASIAALDRAITEVCGHLATQIARDAEGASKLVRIDVSGAADEQRAVVLGRAIASSALWRAAVHGSDPNWGRIVSALGSCDRDLDIDDVEIAIGPEIVFDQGGPAGSLDAARKAMGDDVVHVTCRVGRGPGRAEILSSDLSPEYVTLNAEGST